MQQILRWIGGLFCVIGVALIAANLLMNYQGLGASYNFGDPEKFQFILVPFWQIGVAAGVIGGACWLSSRRLNKMIH
jgi:hypothetical protein